MDEKKGVVLLSGGIDSATTAAIAIERGFELYALVFDYGQKHGIELTHARKLVDHFRIRNHAVIAIPSMIFKSALVSREAVVPKNRDLSKQVIPDTYVPARNIIFLSYALALAESRGASHIFIGANSVDYSGYPDCRPEFFRAYQEVANVGTREGVAGKPCVIETPILNLTKSEIIRKGAALGVDYSLTHSCYDPSMDGRSCGSCDSCIIRKKGFAEAGIPDPTHYV